LLIGGCKGTVLILLKFLCWQTTEATGVFEHVMSLGLKPNAMSYSLLVDAHLVNRDPKAALAVIDAMVMTTLSTD